MMSSEICFPRVMKQKQRFVNKRKMSALSRPYLPLLKFQTPVFASEGKHYYFPTACWEVGVKAGRTAGDGLESGAPGPAPPAGMC